MRVAVLLLFACGDNVRNTPESVASGANDGDHVTVTGEVFATSYDDTMVASRRQELSAHPHDLEYILEQDDEEKRGQVFDYADTGAKYPRTPDHYILIRSTKPSGVTLGDPDFAANRLLPAWGLGIHLTDIDPAVPMPPIGATIKVDGTFHRVMWNERPEMVPIVEPVAITVVTTPMTLAGPGAACTLDEDCNDQLICDRASTTCMPPPREIYWADPWHDVNGACDTDMDCPLGQVCDTTHAISATGMFGAHYFTSQDAGRFLCRLAPGATVASQCPVIYQMRDIVGGRFRTGKEICVRGTLFVATVAEDNDTHDQMRVDEPIPYPTPDVTYDLFGGVTENGPIYKDPTLPGGPIMDPAEGQDVIAIGTFRYDPDHGWYEVHPVKAYLAPP